jgi:hypothetical protein
MNVYRDIALASTRSELATLIQEMSEESERYRIALYEGQRIIAEMKAQMAIQCLEFSAMQLDSRIPQDVREELKNHAEAMGKFYE